METSRAANTCQQPPCGLLCNSLLEGILPGAERIISPTRAKFQEGHCQGNNVKGRVSKTQGQGCSLSFWNLKGLDGTAGSQTARTSSLEGLCQSLVWVVTARPPQ